jgi:hypothetical protein
MGDLLWNIATDIIHTTMQVLEGNKAAYNTHQHGNSIMKLLCIYSSTSGEGGPDHPML